jgi:hypothetical protein
MSDMTKLSLTADCRLVQCPNLMVSPIGTGLAVMGTDSAEDDYFELNGSGRLTWELLQLPKKPAEVVAALAKHYGIDESLCRTDTIKFLQKLLDAGLLRAV